MFIKALTNMNDNLSHSLTRVNESIGSEHFTWLMMLEMIQHRHIKFAVRETLKC